MSSDPGTIPALDIIDDIDAEIIELIQRRREISAAMRSACSAAGRPQSDHAHEMDIFQQYNSALGKSGIRIAGAIVSSCRKASEPLH